ncbi:MAG: methyltransferase domain-containing protein [Candidatus Aenigmarchaeota archaeon]|nr:methyltransferase domain-containing protein [Candidatus Aenigmarchaeota archaeon]
MGQRETKTDKEFWDKTWEGSRLGHYAKISSLMAANYDFHRLLKRHLEKKKGAKRKAIELGSAKGLELVYFAKEFGYEPWGIDYSEHGCEMARLNLKKAGLDGKIICADLFKSKLPKKSFDLVYSGGLIEHFENPGKVVEKHAELLKKGGLLIITIPNYGKSSIYRQMLHKIGIEGEISKTHNFGIMEKAAFRKLFEKRGLEILEIGYYGPINLNLALEPKTGVLLIPFHLINQVLGYLTLGRKSRRLSSGLVVVARKKN